MNEIYQFQKNILKQYKKFKLSKKKKSFKEICFPKTFTYQIPQLFVSSFINPNTNYKSLLIYHKIGAGKTCAAILIGEQWKHKKNIILVCSASLVGNFYKEIRSECTGNNYVTKEEREKLKLLDPSTPNYKNLIKDINKRIDKYYSIYSYNKFVYLINKKKININNALLIIDEVHNIVSEYGSFYNTIYKFIHNAPTNLRIIIMTATPIFDKPMELGLTINLLRPKKLLPIGNEFNDKYIDYKIINNSINYSIKNINELAKSINGLISYYQGAPNYVFPTKKFKIVKCTMNKYQYECYKSILKEEGNIKQLNILKLPNNFFIGSRIISNIAFPNKLINNMGLKALTSTHMKLDNLKNFSIKFYYIIKRILKSTGTIFIYSNFREYGGLLTLVKILEYYKFKNFLEHGVGKYRFAIWSGNETTEQKNKLRDIFNDYSNLNGSKIKIILGSPAIKEGISLLRVRQVHIIDPYWNISRLNQVIGRAIRFCSHKDIPKNKRYVKVYMYLAVAPEQNIKTIDEHIYDIALTKNNISKQFENIIKRTAIDYYLFQK